MKRIASLTLLLLLSVSALFAQSYGKGYFNSRHEVHGRDTLAVIDLWPVYVFKRPADMRRYAKLIQNVKAVYPIAKEARARLSVMEATLLQLKTEKEQRAYVKRMEQELKTEYTPVLKRMTFSQGKILIKLIDRETSRTSYELVRELRGGFRAFFWQGIARIFGANLKDTYDKEGEDKVIEQIILMYEAGLI